jgi:hypothetical protein
MRNRVQWRERDGALALCLGGNNLSPVLQYLFSLDVERITWSNGCVLFVHYRFWAPGRCIRSKRADTIDVSVETARRSGLNHVRPWSSSGRVYRHDGDC